MTEKTIQFIGLAEFAQHLPNDDWYEIKVRIRKLPYEKAEVYVVDEVENVDTGDIASIELMNKKRIKS